MDIVLCTDNNLVKQTCVLITSVLLTNADEKIHFHILTLGTTEDDKIKLEKSVRNIAEITLYTILEKDFNQFPIHSSYITRGTYLRFFIEEALPKTIKKALYLDIDIIVCKSLKNLYEISLQNYSCAAALDVECHDVSRYNRLCYNMADLYFNAGVILINLEWWRKEHVSKKAFEFLLKNPQKCLFHDQDALNFVLHGTVFHLPNSYNAMYAFFKSEIDSLLILREKFEELKNEASIPVIIHYAGKLKPWHKEYHSFHYPFGKTWLFFIQKSGIKISIKPYKTKSKITLKALVKRIFSSIGLIKPEFEKQKESFVDTSSIENDLLKDLQETRI